MNNTNDFQPQLHKLNIDESDGLLMTVLISMSHRRRDVYFEVHRVGDRIKLYWCFETFIHELCQYYKDAHGLDDVQMTFEELFSNEELRKIAWERTVQDSSYVEEDDTYIFENIIKNGFPNLDRKIPMGLDGHHYEITIKGNPDKEYYAWCEIPKEWGDLKELIGLLMKYAKLDEMYSVQGMA
jgi:hypothetical protein